MALVTPTQQDVGDGYGGGILFTWVLTTADHTGKALGAEIVQHSDMCWHAIGTWGGATAAIEGSNTDTNANYGAMTNAAGGSAITWTADGAPKQSNEKPVFVRPRLSTVGVGASVTVTMLARRNQLARKA
jgi:hypothetical protein